MHSLAQTSTGQVYTWGSNTRGQLGDGTFSDRWVPTLLTLTNLAAMSGGDQHSLAALAGGSVSTWGNNGYSQLGDGTTGGQRNAPAAISGPSGVISVSGADRHSLAYGADGSIWSWGTNTSGQLGDGTNVNSNVPLRIRDATGWLVATPRLSPGAGAYSAAQTVTVTETTPGATIRYTTTGVDPTTSDTVIASGGTVAVNRTLTLKAKAWKAGWTDSNVATAVYTLTVPTPTLTQGGTFNTPQTVTIACAVAGARRSGTPQTAPTRR